MSNYDSMTVNELKPIVSQVKITLRNSGVKLGNEFKNLKKKSQLVNFLENYDEGNFDTNKSVKWNKSVKSDKKSVKGPKRPRNSWILFSTEMRPLYAEKFSHLKDKMNEEHREYRKELKRRKDEGEDTSDLEKKSLFNVFLTQEMSKEWKQMSEDDKLPYTKMALDDKDRYEREKSTFEN